jgi:predicted deacylase
LDPSVEVPNPVSEETTPRVELAAPDITRWRAGTADLPYVHSFEGPRTGPHVLITGLVHGNEICGAIALDRLLSDHLLDDRLMPVRGRLSFAFVNTAAYECFDPANPTASRFVDEDFNRLWSPEVLDGPRSSVELARARELRPLVETVDLLLYIHSLQQGDDAMLLSGPLEKGRSLARQVGTPAIVVADSGHAAGIRLRDYAGFADPASAKNALLVECGQHWRAGSETVALETAIRFLAATGTIEAATAQAYGVYGAYGAYGACGADAPTPPQHLIEVSEAVTVTSEDFAFEEPYRGFEVIAEAGTVIARDGARTISTPYDNCVLVMPSLRLKPGQTAVRLGRRIS